MELTPSLFHGLRVGVLGGSFNPAHSGHFDISNAARRQLGLDRVVWLVTPQNPLKGAGDYLPLAERVGRAWVFCDGAPWLTVSAIEAAWNVSYTIDTVQRLTTRFAASQWVWLMGADSLASFHKWRAWREIAQTLPICIISRPHENMAALTSPAAQALRSARCSPPALGCSLSARLPRWAFISHVHNPLSATQLREREKGFRR